MVIKLSSQLAINSHGLQNRAALWGLVGMAFTLQPTFTLTFILLLAWWEPTSSRRSLLGILLLVSLYLALVNVTKLPESDMANYLVTFAEAQQVDITTYLLLNTREPIYYLSLYGLANLPGVDGLVYVFLSTLLPYLIYGTALLRLGKALHIDHRALLSVLIVLMFLPQLFSLSAHLFRQFLAACLVMLFLSEHTVTGRRRWGVGLLGMMVHYSAIPFVLLSFIKPLKRYSAKVSVLFNALILLALYALLVQIAPLLLDVPVFGIVFQRLVNGEGAELEPLTLPALGVAALFLAISLVTFTCISSQALGANAWSLHLCTAIVCVVVLLSSMQPTLSEIATRYFFYLYFLIGFWLIVLMKRIPVTRWAVHGLALLSLPLFFYKLAYGEWIFAPLGSLLVEPTWLLWGYQGSSHL